MDGRLPQESVTVPTASGNQALVRPSAATLFLCGDVMTGRGIDQILAVPGKPLLHEPHVQDAREYVELAERVNGPIPRKVSGTYLWGEALSEWKRVAADVAVMNLETAITRSDEYDRAKFIHYRMNPANANCLTAAGVDCCAVANNHMLDWGRTGLQETLDTLARAGIATAGAGSDITAAMRPFVRELPARGRVLVFACGCESAGVPSDWAAMPQHSGVWLIDEGSGKAVDQVAACVSQVKRSGDLVALSIHWGENWGYRIPHEQREFAYGVIDRAGVDIVYGHSSHHVKGIEVYRERPIFYGCGDFLSDYEGIRGSEAYRDDLGLMYFVTMDLATGELLQIDLTPTQLCRFRLTRPSAADMAWLTATLDRECRRLETVIVPMPDGRMRWQPPD